MRTIGLAGLVLALTSCADKEPPKPLVLEHPVDQVFLDHNGYRTLFKERGGEWQQRKYFQVPWCESISYPQLDGFKGLHDAGRLRVRVYSDLPEGTRGYARIVLVPQHNDCTASVASWDQDPSAGTLRDRASFAEIHLPRSSKLDAGSEEYGGKHRTDAQMHELK